MQARIVFTLNNTTKTITDSDLLEGVTIRQDINTGDDLICGVVSSAECTFAINNATGWFTSDYKTSKFEVFLKQMDESEYKSYGIFYISEAKKTKNKVSITAYDITKQLSSKIVDEWIEATTFPISMYNMLKSLCTYCNLTLANTSITNGDFSVQDNFNGTNINAVQIISYIAQASGSYAIINPDGKLELKWYTDKNISLTIAETVSTVIEEFECPVIDKIQIRLTDDDIGVISGTGTNALIIQDNPVLYANEAAEITSIADNLLAKMNTLAYTPSSIELLKDHNIQVGDIITCKGVKTIVSSKEISPSGVKISCTGQIKRSTQQVSINSQLNRLRGKYNELTRTIESTVSRLGDAEGNISKIEQTAESIKTEVSSIKEIADSASKDATDAKNKTATIEENVSSLEQTATEIKSTVSSVKKTADDAKTAADGANTKAEELESTISEVSQTADKINWLVKSGTSESDFEMTDRTVSIISNNISLTGYVKFSDLTQEGSTSINGANITTGKISASRIDATELKVCTIYCGSAATTNKVAIDCTSSLIMYIGGSASTVAEYDEMRFYGKKFTFGSWDWSNQLIIDISNKCIRTNSVVAGWTLGSTTYKFGKLYTGDGDITVKSGSLYINGSEYKPTTTTPTIDTLKSSSYSVSLSSTTFAPDSTSYSLGSSSKYWKNAYIGTLNLCYSTSRSIALACNSSGNLTIGGTEYKAASSSTSISKIEYGSYSVSINSSREFNPASSASYNLGSSSYLWNYLYTKYIRLYYNSYTYVELACNSSSKLTSGGKVVTTA